MAELKEILTQIKDEVYQEGYEKGVYETLDMLIDYFSYMKKKKRIVVDPEEDIKLLKEVIRKGQSNESSSRLFRQRYNKNL